MNPSVGELLPELLADLAPVLAGDAPRARLAAPSVAALPLLSGLLLECPLGGYANPEAPVGLALRAAGASDFAALEKIAGSGDAAWRAIAPLLRARREDETLRESFPECWLEFDLDAAPPIAPGALEPPSIFVQVAEPVGRPPRLGPDVAARCERSTAILNRALELLGADWPGVRGALARVLAAMPASTRISYLGVMLARGQRGCRLTFDRMPLDGGCTALLRAIGGIANDAGVVGAIDFLAAWTPHAVLHIDLAPAVGGTTQAGPLIGFEFEPELLAIADFQAAAVARRLLTTEQLRALPQWPQRRHRATAGHVWPAALAHATYLARTLNHLKLVIATDQTGAEQSATLKIYLGASWSRAFPAPSLWG